VTVADLQQILTDLERLLATAGLKSSATAEVSGFAAALGRFRDQELKSLTDLLSRVGLDGTVTPKATAKKATAGGHPPVDLAALTRRVKEVYDGAAQEWVTEQVVNELCAQLERKEVTKDALGKMAAEIEHKVKASDSKPKIVAAIRNRITDRIGATTRRQLIDRPGGAPNGTGEA
jgi:hypothetical protein